MVPFGVIISASGGKFATTVTVFDISPVPSGEVACKLILTSPASAKT